MKTDEAIIIENDYQQLTGIELKAQLTDKKVVGDYLYGYKFIGVFNADGTTEGENNVGTHHHGKWSINEETNTLSVEWKVGWDNWTARAYNIDGIIKLYDCDTGNWRTTFKEFKNQESE